MVIMINVVNDDCGFKLIRVKKNIDFFFLWKYWKFV